LTSLKKKETNLKTHNNNNKKDDEPPQLLAFLSSHTSDSLPSFSGAGFLNSARQ